MTPPQPPPPHGPPPTHHGSMDGLQDEEVLRFAPPEIRRLWKRVVSLETQIQDVRETLRRIEEHLTGKTGGA